MGSCRIVTTPTYHPGQGLEQGPRGPLRGALASVASGLLVVELLLAPLVEQDAAAARVSLVERDDLGQAVRAEVAVVLSGLAPAHEDSALREVPDGQRPDRPLALLAASAAVDDLELALVADRVAELGEIPTDTGFVSACLTDVNGRPAATEPETCRSPSLVARDI